MSGQKKEKAVNQNRLLCILKYAYFISSTVTGLTFSMLTVIARAVQLETNRHLTKDQQFTKQTEIMGSVKGLMNR